METLLRFSFIVILMEVAAAPLQISQWLLRRCVTRMPKHCLLTLA